MHKYGSGFGGARNILWKVKRLRNQSSELRNSTILRNSRDQPHDRSWSLSPQYPSSPAVHIWEKPAAAAGRRPGGNVLARPRRPRAKTWSISRSQSSSASKLSAHRGDRPPSMQPGKEAGSTNTKSPAQDPTHRHWSSASLVEPDPLLPTLMATTNATTITTTTTTTIEGGIIAQRRPRAASSARLLPSI
jgi:hypothetical protein